MNHGNSPESSKPSSDKNFFDWLTPHHDIIRNHPHYRKVHFGHHQCIHKKKSGLFDFIGSLFESGSNRKFDDPYRNLDNHSRCLTPEYYKNNIIDLEKIISIRSQLVWEIIFSISKIKLII